MYIYVLDSLDWKKNIASRFSEANASEFTGNPEEMYYCYLILLLIVACLNLQSQSIVLSVLKGNKYDLEL